MSRERQRDEAIGSIMDGVRHPLRRRIMAEFAKDRPRAIQHDTAGAPWRRTKLSPNELAKALDAPLGTVAYHVRMLEDRGLLVLAGTEPRRGAMEHYYRLTGRGVAAIEVSELASERV
jgi:DNA-binding transcriptional ArsR family regulator